MRYFTDYSQDEANEEWMLENSNIGQFRPDVKTITLKRDGEIVGSAAFDNFTVTDCQIHCVSDGTRRWLTREFLKLVFIYPFIQLGYNRLTALVSMNNADSLRFIKNIGFVEEGLARRAGVDGEDVQIFGLLKEECKYIQPLIFSSNIG